MTYAGDFLVTSLAVRRVKTHRREVAANGLFSRKHGRK